MVAAILLAPSLILQFLTFLLEVLSHAILHQLSLVHLMLTSPYLLEDRLRLHLFSYEVLLLHRAFESIRADHFPVAMQFGTASMQRRQVSARVSYVVLSDVLKSI